jgi:hypothetical protein
LLRVQVFALNLKQSCPSRDANTQFELHRTTGDQASLSSRRERGSKAMPIWLNSVDGNWADGTKWDSGVPNGNTAVASFTNVTSASSGGRTIDLGGDRLSGGANGDRLIGGTSVVATMKSL